VVVRAATDAAVDVATAPQLFLDDMVIQSTRGLERRFHQPVKHGLIHEADGRPWERGGVISVVRGGNGLFHMTYHLHYWDASVRDLHPSIGDDKAHWFRLPTAYATSTDGVGWQKPVLGLVEGPTGFQPAPRAKWPDGMFEEPSGRSRQNNLGCPIHTMLDLATFGGMNDERRRFLINVIQKDDDHAFGKVTDAGLYLAADVPELQDPQWRKRMETIWEGPRRGPRGEAVRAAGYDSREGVWFECNQSSFGDFKGRGGRDISRWTSTDLREWSQEELVLPIADDESRDPADWVEYMTLHVSRVGDFWLGFLVIFHGDRTNPQYEMPGQPGIWRKGLHDVRLVMSRDAGKTWQRVGGKQAWLTHHEAEDGYDRLLGIMFSPVRVGDELWFYYGCWDGDHLSWNRDGTPYYANRMRIWRTARATIRWDGFMSLRADETGEVSTKPLATTSRRLALNVAAQNGSLRAELQSADGTPLPGFTLADCHPLVGEGVSQAVQWREATLLPSAANERPFRLRFEIRHADLYGFQFQG